MSELFLLGLADATDACDIAQMSRDLVEQGLEWTWTPARVLRAIGSRDSSVVVARRDGGIAAFAVMHLGEEAAHLSLLAVADPYRRRGLGRCLLEWLSATAVEAGVFRMDLELRVRNAGARAFYEALGFVALDEVPGYYRGLEAALRMSRSLIRADIPPA